mmetsp:Transcript_27031/g.54422  ORF Transcript_27031/g.54422 Transcript_27031/m.54422 type:complete len:134 (+) Transcript_27031:550-951(+)
MEAGRWLRLGSQLPFSPSICAGERKGEAWREERERSGERDTCLAGERAAERCDSKARFISLTLASSRSKSSRCCSALASSSASRCVDTGGVPSRLPRQLPSPTGRWGVERGMEAGLAVAKVCCASAISCDIAE